jgi:hypothetical protein
MLCNDSHFTLTYQEHRVQRPFVKINQFVRVVEVRAVVKNLLFFQSMDDSVTISYVHRLYAVAPLAL